MSATISIALLRAIFRRLQVQSSEIRLPKSDLAWTDAMSSVLHEQGFTVKEWTTTLPKVATQVGIGLPVLGLTPKGEWILLEDSSWQWIRYYNLSQNIGRWRSIRSLSRSLGTESITWLLIEPLQPKSVMSATVDSPRPLYRLWQLIVLERFDLFLTVLLSGIIGVFALSIPLTIQTLINWVAFGGFTQPIISLSVAVFVILSISGGLTVFQRLIVERLERRLFIRTVEDLSRRFYYVQISLLDRKNVSDLANRFFDILTVQKASSTMLIEGLGAALQILVATTVLAVYHPYFMAFDLVLLLGMALIFRLFAKQGTRTAIVESKAKYRNASWIESIAFHTEQFRLGNHQIASLESERLVSTWLENREKHFNVFLFQFGSAQIFYVCMSVILLLLGGSLVFNGELSVGQFVAAEFVVTSALIGFMKFVDKMDTIYDLLASIDKIGAVLDLKVEDVPGIPRPPTHEIQVDLEHTIPCESTSSIDLQLGAGLLHIMQCPMMTSPSRIAEVLCGVRAPKGGFVKHNGMDIRRLALSDRYSGVNLIGPNSSFEGSIRDNITMGCPDISDEKMWAVLHEIGLENLFQSHPAGLQQSMIVDTPLLTKGILLARALVANKALTVFYSFFEGLTIEWRLAWLSLLHEQHPGTIVILETVDIEQWTLPNGFHHSDRIGVFGGWNAT